MNTELTKIINTFHHGDCLEVLPTLPDACVDLIVTSPPYADSRKDTYGGIPPDGCAYAPSSQHCLLPHYVSTGILSGHAERSH